MANNSSPAQASLGWPAIIFGITALGVIAWAAGLRKKSVLEPIPAIPPGAVPVQPTTPIAPGTAPMTPPARPLTFLSDPLVLQQNQEYRARLELSGIERLASPQMIAQRFQILGFDNVQVFTDDNLPNDWPFETTLGTNPATRYVQGRWPLADVSIPKPAQIQLVWKHLAPSSPPPTA